MGVTKVEIIPIRPQQGLIAFAAIEIDDQFYVNSIGVHKKLDGLGYRITYPTKKVGNQNITICHPIQSTLSKEVERMINTKANEVFNN